MRSDAAPPRLARPRGAWPRPAAAGRPLALADEGAQEERRERGDGDVGLRAQGPVVDGLLEERPDVVGGHPDGHAGGDGDRQRGARRPEPERGPDQGGKDQVGDRLRRSRSQSRRERRPSRSEDRPPRCACVAMPRRIRGPTPAPGGRTTSPPDVSPSNQVRQNVSASEWSMTPPASIEIVPAVALIAVAIARGHEHAADLLDSIEARARADQPAQQHRPDDDLGHVAGLLAEEAAERQALVAEEELAVYHELREEHPRPPAESPQVESRDPKPGGRPRRTPTPYTGASGRAWPRRSTRPRGRARPPRTEPVAIAASRALLGTSADLGKVKRRCFCCPSWTEAMATPPIHLTAARNLRQMT